MGIFTNFQLHIVFINNLVAQSPDINLVENLSNLHTNREALNK